jgi:alkylated DNA repair protein (DNA oxidative demethylase)
MTSASSLDLFQDVLREPRSEPLDSGAVILRAFVAGREAEILQCVEQIAAVAPFRHLVTPGGYRMSVAMTNSGTLGWVSDRRGYRYDPIDPTTQRPWPPMPALFRRIAAAAAVAAGYERFAPEACLINRYEPGARLSLHQDQDEKAVAAPIVSVSIGSPATFLWGGPRRSDKTRRIGLESGDVVVWGGASRFFYHGVAPLKAQWQPLTGEQRINVTFRKVRSD